VTSAFSSKEVALPVGAEEGFTGFLEGPKITDREMTQFSIDVPLKMDGLQGDITKEEVLKLDSEGRCVITDHGYFGEWMLCKNFPLARVIDYFFFFMCLSV
jgi:AP endonuclease 2